MDKSLSERDTHSFIILIQFFQNQHSDAGRLLGKDDSESLPTNHVSSKQCDYVLGLG